MHWLSAVRHLPDKDPLRDVFEKEFVGSNALKSIAKQKPPKPSTTKIAIKIAQDDTLNKDDKRYLLVSPFLGKPFH
jgi:hypothetical protein